MLLAMEHSGNLTNLDMNGKLNSRMVIPGNERKMVNGADIQVGIVLMKNFHYKEIESFMST